MELRLLQYFLAIAREETILKAAESLHITQPTLSRQMKELEDYLGKPLFIRGSRKISLTEEGIILRQRAEEIISLVEKTENEIMLLDEEISGDVYIGSGETIGMQIIAKAIKKCQDAYPHIQFHLYSGNEQDVVDRLEKGLLDFGLVIQPANIYKYNYLTLPYKDIWGIYVTATHPLALHNKITSYDLSPYPLICSTQELKYKQFENWAQQEFKHYHISSTYNLIYNASLLAKENNAIIIGLKDLINHESFKFIPLFPQLEAGLDVIWKKYKVLSKPAQYFLNELKKQIKSS